MRIKRSIPYPGRVAVELGQKVTPDTLIAETILQPAEPVHLSVTELFGIAPNRLDELLQVRQGDDVHVGQVLAVGSFEGQVYELKSPGNGRIEQVSPLLGTISLRLEGDPDDRDRQVDVAKDLDMPALLVAQYLQVRVGDQVRLGQLLATDPDQEVASFAPMQGEVVAIDGAVVTIRRPFVRTQALAFLAGKIVEVLPSWGAVIESENVPWQGIFGLGGECFGELRLLVHTAEQVAPAPAISAADSGKIVVAGAVASLELLHACKQHGVAGVIAGGAHNLDLVQIHGAEITPGMETAQSLGLTLLLSEGMGQIAMEPRFFKALQQAEGQIVSMNGLTQIRAGVIRPCVYLPGLQSADPQLHKTEPPAIAVGSIVRIIREPWFGMLGTVLALTGPELLPSGISTLTYEIKTEDGVKLHIARSNVEFAELG